MKVTSRLVGVIDLLGCQAVHAVAGQRDRYQPVPFCEGDPIRLAEHYRDLGIPSLYIADLDAILTRNFNASLIAELAELFSGECCIDLGWSGSESDQDCGQILRLAKQFPNLRWIVATESCRDRDAFDEFAAIVSNERTFLGLDYRQGLLIAKSGDESSWLAHAADVEVGGVVILDLAEVGKSRGPATAETCRRVKAGLPQVQVYSGGGIRSAEDVRRLLAAGCDRCLVATALQPG